MPPQETIIAQTEKWITEVVVGCNFCPFAAREVKRGSIRYTVLPQATISTALKTLKELFTRLDSDASIETSFLILPEGFSLFGAYLKLVDRVAGFIKKEGYEGVYQIASFHPVYLFAGSTVNDAANYTNRSPYPMLQVLREESVSRAIDIYPDTAAIPERNIAFARAKGLAFMQALKAHCMEAKA